MSTSAAAPKSYGSERSTAGLRVRTFPVYVPARSDPDARQYIFSYRVRISNESESAVTLLARRWIIVDASGERHEVEGEGVVGRQPTIAPGQTFEYTSYCPLTTPWGTMEGEYTMRRSTGGAAREAESGTIPLEDDAGDTFVVPVGRFYLVAQPVETEAGQGS